jgi:hypothetical protein
VPGVVHPRRASEPIFTDNLGIQLECRTCLAPGFIRNFGPHGAEAFDFRGSKSRRNAERLQQQTHLQSYRPTKFSSMRQTTASLWSSQDRDTTDQLILFKPSDNVERPDALNWSRCRGSRAGLREPHPVAEVGSNAAPQSAVFQRQRVRAVEFSVPVFAGVVVIATREFDEHARLVAHRPRIVTRWQQHDIVL